jgi:hypothetical protein
MMKPEEHGTKAEQRQDPSCLLWASEATTWQDPLGLELKPRLRWGNWALARALTFVVGAPPSGSVPAAVNWLKRRRQTAEDARPPTDDQITSNAARSAQRKTRKPQLIKSNRNAKTNHQIRTQTSKSSNAYTHRITS